MRDFKKGDKVEFVGRYNCLSIGYGTKGEIYAAKWSDNLRFSIVRWLYKCFDIVLIKVHYEDLIQERNFNLNCYPDGYYILPVSDFNLLLLKEASNE